MTRRRALRLSAAACMSLIAPGPSGGNPSQSARRLLAAAREYDATVAVEWYDVVLRLFAERRLGPPVAARALGYLGVGLHESIGAGIPDGRSLVGQLNGLRALPAAQPGEHHWPAVASSALATMVKNLVPGRPDGISVLIAALEDEHAEHFRAATPPAVFERSVAFGRAIGIAIVQWSLGDGFTRHKGCPYSPPAGPGRWEPTPPAFDRAAQACWGRLRPFVLRDALEVDPGPPPPYSERRGSPFFREAEEVYETGNTLTDEQRAIALFWADGPGTPTPAGHAIAILDQLIRDRRCSLDVAAEAYARVGIAAADAFIGCWAVKYRDNLLRPVTYIRKVIDPTWQPFLDTPPFPEYVSGHSVQSGATMQVLTDLFGEGVAFTDRTHEAVGLAARSFASFRQAGEEAALSRLYGGIHYRTSNERGLAMGRRIGRKVGGLRLRD